MRKARLKMMLIAAMTAFGLLFAGAERMQAQSTNSADDFYNIPAANWVSQTEALSLLTIRMDQLSALLQTLTPGTQPYLIVLRDLICYRTVYQEVEAGKQIPDSISQGLSNCINDAMGTGIFNLDDIYPLKAEAIDMLSN